MRDAASRPDFAPAEGDVCCLGEAMLEFSPTAEHTYRRSFGGDAYNTAVYLARAGVRVELISRIGDDRFSDALLEELSREGIGSTAVSRAPGASLGLYLIDTDERGERSFSYWRSASPARHLFDHAELPRTLRLLYLTGVTVAVAYSAGRVDRMEPLLQRARDRGATIVFDPNYRPSLWPCSTSAQEILVSVMRHCDVALPSMEDAQALYGIENVEQCDQFYRSLGVRERVTKAGPDLMASDDQQRATLSVPLVSAVDTTAAGDAFNAGYIAARLRGASMADGLALGARFAEHVVRFPGAIAPRELWSGRKPI